jgi:hypothetical protein
MFPNCIQHLGFLLSWTTANRKTSFTVHLTSDSCTASHSIQTVATQILSDHIFITLFKVSSFYAGYKVNLDCFSGLIVSFWLQIRRSRVRFPSSSSSATYEYSWRMEEIVTNSLININLTVNGFVSGCVGDLKKLLTCGDVRVVVDTWQFKDCHNPQTILSNRWLQY